MSKPVNKCLKMQKNESYISCSMIPPQLCRQEKIWTCSVAAIRTILSAFGGKVLSEAEFIKKYNLVKGPHYTEEIMSKKMLGKKKVLSCLDFANQEISLKLLNNLLKEKYYIMAECLYNCAHWVVVLAYIATGGKGDLKEHRILFYDPYYDETRLVRADEFYEMWCDIDGHRHEFIAVMSA